MKYFQYGSQTIDDTDIAAVTKTLRSKFLTSGPNINEFESKISKYVGSKYAVACNSGTAALHMAFKAIGLKKNDKVILPAINFIAAANLCKLMGAKIYFADVDKFTGQMTPKTLIECLEKNRIRKLKMFCTMYNGGAPLNVVEFKKLKKELRCYIVEDCCHALGGMKKKKKKEYVGNCKYGDIATFSFHPVKTITTGEGGMLVTNSSIFFKRAKLFRNHGMEKKIIPGKNNWSYDVREVGLNYRMSEIQSALGISQLKKINKFISKRELVAQKYNQQFDKINLAESFKNLNKDIKSAWHLYVINFDFKKLRINKEAFIQKLHKSGVGVQIHYIPNYYQPLYTKQKKSYAGVKKYFDNSLSIPIHPNLTNSDVHNIIKIITGLINKYLQKKYISNL